MKRFYTCVLSAAIVAGAWGCGSKGAIQSAEDALNKARTNCGAEYASPDFQRAQKLLEEARGMEKASEARKRASEAKSAAVASEKAALAHKESAKQEAEAAIAEAKKAVEKAKASDAPQYAAAKFNMAQAKLRDAEAEMKKSDCNYLKARDLAKEAARLAEESIRDAEKAKEDERRRLEEEARKAQEVGGALGRLTEWIVKRGDTLWGIAKNKDVYGDPFLWPLIFKENRSKIKNPDLIYPKQQFKINQASSDADRKAADKHARNRRWPDVPAGYDDAYAGR
jgi:nucleoid-associated protein YgaU